MKHRNWIALAALSALALAAGLRCGGGADDASDTGGCTTHAECPSGVCIDGRCVPLAADGDADIDVPAADADIDVPGADADADADADAEVIPEVLPEVPPDTSLVDGDGDTIPDEIEGWDDVDGDTIPNAADDDSDGDDIPDAVEAGDSDPRTMPADSDRDGTPDFLDLDSDNDTILDSDEWLSDVDGDTIPAYRDFDSDGDGIFDNLEAGDTDPATPPRDSDGDTIPDYLDVDSDNDTISDAHESLVDTDGDTVMDYLDLDSDDDGVPDRDEAGDADLATPPLDCDGDTLPNFRDTDSDNDGLRDFDELTAHHTDPCLADTDGDTVTDLIEISYGSGATDPADSPRTRGDFVFIVEYSPPPAPPIPPDPLRDTLSFATDLQKADVYFALDTSGSMGGEIANLRTGLRTTIVPGIAARIPDVQFGAGRFEDCPTSTCANAMNNVQDITPTISLVQTALDSMTNLCGGSEPYLDMLWLLATGNPSVYTSANVRPRPRRCTDASTIGWPCFRPDAVKIIIQCGDESATQSCAGRSVATIGTAMNAQHIKLIGIASGSSARAGFESVARETGSVDATTGLPLVFTIAADGTGLSSTVVDAVDQLARNIPIRVDAIPSDDPSDAVDAVAQFIDYMETNTSGATVMGRVCTSLTTGDANGDGHPDYFPTVFPGTSVCWDIVAKSNVTVPATEDPQIFRAIIDVIGDGYTPLDQRSVYFLVPPVIPGSQ